MRDLTNEELGQVYGAGGGCGKSGSSSKKHGSSKHKSSKHKSSKKKSSHKKSGSRCCTRSPARLCKRGRSTWGAAPWRPTVVPTSQVTCGRQVS